VVVHQKPNLFVQANFGAMLDLDLDKHTYTYTYTHTHTYVSFGARWYITQKAGGESTHIQAYSHSPTHTHSHMNERRTQPKLKSRGERVPVAENIQNQRLLPHRVEVLLDDASLLLDPGVLGEGQLRVCFHVYK
jgi:hypothetical protein